ncbi:MAG: PRC-barrel domain-containing protein [Candidatus Competibacteraceae bacterium]|nr:PRC-barrel domain-containing protein [Candidatus Competibacteraceae bacterium]
MSKKMGLILVAMGLSAGLAFAQQQGGDYRQTNPAASETTPMPSTTKPEATPKATGTIAEQAANQIRIKELIGAKAVHEGRDVGKVDDLLVEEKRQGRGVVLSVGGVLGIGDRLVAVPWEQVDLIKIKGSKPTLYIAMTQEQLESAPYFEPSKSDQRGS